MQHTQNTGNLRNTNSNLNQEEFARGRLTLASRPRMIFVELTRACNLSCPMCRPTLIAGPQYRMSDVLVSRIRNELFPYVECVDLRGSGESTLDERLLPLAGELANCGVRIHLYTNMCSRGSEYWRQLGQLPLNLTVSIDAASEEGLRALRGASKWKLLSNLSAFQLGRLASPQGAHALHFSVVVSDNNLTELQGLVQLAADFGVSVVKLNPLTQPNPARNGYPRIGVSAVHADALHARLLEATALSRTLGVQLQLCATLDNNGGGGFDRCLHPWSYCVIQYDGTVVYCDHFVANPNAIVGSVATLPFMDVWNGFQYQAIRRNHLNKTFESVIKCGLECDWCYKGRYADFEGIFEFSFKPLILTQ